ncbi:MAG TPA: hypothetical protein VJI13_06055, partial [Candidatus Norongarragalinales archaeon]|nr:hypothetical protein [Candidatus Norongarragalinales archaeon]
MTDDYGQTPPASEDKAGFYASMEGKYYSFMESLEGERGIPVKKYFMDPFENAGIPTFPVILLLLLLIVSASIYLLLPRAPPSLEVMVFSGGDPLQDAVARLEFWGNLPAVEIKTDKKGVAKFQSLRKGNAVLVVSKEGFADFKDTVEITGKGSLKVDLSASASSVVGFEITVTSFDGKSLPGAQLQIFVDSKQSGGITDGSGKFSLMVPPASSVMVGASMEGYKVQSRTAKAQSKRMVIILEAKEPVPDVEKAVPRAHVSLSVKGDDGPSLSAQVKVYDSRVGGAAIASLKTSADGSAQIKDLPVGMPVRFVASAKGYLEGKEERALEETNDVSITLKKATGPQENMPLKTEFIVRDFRTQLPIPNANITIFNRDNELVESLSLGASGEGSLELQKGAYYAIAQASGYEYSKQTFGAGDKKTFLLRPQAGPANPSPGALPTNKSKLMINVADEDGKTYRTAVNFYDNQSELVPPLGKFTSSGGELLVDIDPGTYVVKAVKDVLFASKTISVPQDSQLLLTMYYPRGYLKIDGRNTKTQAAVSPFNLILIDAVEGNYVAYRQCAGQECKFWVRGYRKFEASGTAANYEAAKFDVTINQVNPASNIPGQALPDGTIAP